MEEQRYFYYVPGGEVEGPVDVAALRQLFAAGTIDANAQLCAEGAQEWQPIDPAFFAPQEAVPPAHIPPPPAVMPPAPREYPPAAVAVPTAVTPPLYVGPAASPHGSVGGSDSTWAGSRRWSLGTTIGVVIAVAVAGLNAFLGPGEAGRPLGFQIGGVIGGCLAFILIPFLLSLLCFGRARPARQWVFLGLVIFFIGLVTLGKHAEKEQQDEQRLFATVNADQQKNRESVLAQVKAKGYYTSTSEDSEKKLQQLRNDVGNGNSDVARIARDLLEVPQELVGKVKEVEVAEKGVDYEISDLQGPDDIAAREKAIGAVEDKQNGVVDFLEHIDDACRAALSKDGFSDDVIKATTAGFRKSGHVEILVGIWKAQAKLSSDHIARFEYLKKTSSQWKYDGGKVTFDNQAELDQFDVLTDALHGDVKTIGDLQKQLVQAPAAASPGGQ